MKRLFLICSLLLAFGSLAQAQTYYEKNTKAKPIHIELSNLTTRSIYGWKTGVSLTANINNRMSLSYVNLIDINNQEGEGDTFRGGQYQYYFNPKNNLSVGLGLMVGFYNEQFLAVTPSVEVKYVYNDRFVAGMGFSRVDTYPKFDFRVGMRLFK